MNKIVVGSNTAPQSLDPIMTSDVQNELTVASAYDKLVDFDEKGNLRPALATAWRIGEDGRSVTLTLRRNVTFHSGNAFTAKDVIYTLDRIKTLGMGTAAFVSEYMQATSSSPLDVTIQLARPNVTFISALSKIYILDSALVQQHAGSDHGQSWLASHEAGSGVYRLSMYIPGQRSTFTRYDKSWRNDPARPDKLSFLYLPNSSTISQELQAGTVDVGITLAIPDVLQLEQIPDFRVARLPTPLQTYAFLNMRNGLTSDRRIRRAIALAYDYEGHVETILDGYGSVASGIAAPSVKCRIELPSPGRDLAAARRLVKAAGAQGKALSMAYNPAFAEHRRAALALQSGLQQIGLKLSLQPVTFPQYMAMLGNPDSLPEISILWDFPNYPEIGPMLSRIFDSAHIGMTNYSIYSNPKVDSLLRAGLNASDAHKACSDFKSAQALIAKDQPLINIADSQIAVVTGAQVGGPEFRPTFQLIDPTTLTITANTRTQVARK
ncbi:ABC transporter substrate-binding protein [Novosphingobium pentaromativorans]|nr:ABC transporter substrate-binding protein [Novosphingobium pentaromativorans]AIT80778.1 hypothetical protein JI59_13845 [Novosphingobium pentaromativorans US6-1]